MNFRNKAKIFPHIHVIIQRICFGQIANFLFYCQWFLCDVDTRNKGLAAILLQVTRNYFHGGGFAGPIRSKETDDLTLINFEGYIIYSFLLAINLQKILYFYRHKTKVVAPCDNSTITQRIRAIVLSNNLTAISPLLRFLNRPFHNTGTIYSDNSPILLKNKHGLPVLIFHMVCRV